jgi:hypothetical protein
MLGGYNGTILINGACQMAKRILPLNNFTVGMWKKMPSGIDFSISILAHSQVMAEVKIGASHRTMAVDCISWLVDLVEADKQDEMTVATDHTTSKVELRTFVSLANGKIAHVIFSCDPLLFTDIFGSEAKQARKDCSMKTYMMKRFLLY